MTRNSASLEPTQVSSIYNKAIVQRRQEQSVYATPRVETWMVNREVNTNSILSATRLAGTSGLSKRFKKTESRYNLRQNKADFEYDQRITKVYHQRLPSIQY
jgi:hypothetical protein